MPSVVIAAITTAHFRRTTVQDLGSGRSGLATRSVTTSRFLSWKCVSLETVFQPPRSEMTSLPFTREDYGERHEKRIASVVDRALRSLDLNMATKPHLSAVAPGAADPTYSTLFPRATVTETNSTSGKMYLRSSTVTR